MYIQLSRDMKHETIAQLIVPLDYCTVKAGVKQQSQRVPISYVCTNVK